MFFLEFSCFFDDPANVGNLISGSSAFSKTSLNIWKFTVHILLKPDLENFEHYFASVWVECSCLVVWAFFGIAFLWNYFLLTPNLMVKRSVVTAVLKVGMGMISYYTQSLLWMNSGICLLFPCYSTRCWKPQHSFSWHSAYLQNGTNLF